MWTSIVVNVTVCTESLNMLRKMLLERVLEFADGFGLKIAITRFKKDVKKPVAYEWCTHRTLKIC